MSKTTMSILVGSAALTAALLVAGNTARAEAASSPVCGSIGCGGGPRACADITMGNPACREPGVMCCPEPEIVVEYCYESVI